MSPGNDKGYKVLVVDDDPSVLATYRRLLRRSGFQAQMVNDPMSVLRNGAAADADLLLLDYRMPGIDGLSLLAELRRKECKARCILLSAYLDDDVRAQARHLGVDRVMEKPVDVCALRLAIQELLPITTGRPA